MLGVEFDHASIKRPRLKSLTAAHQLKLRFNDAPNALTTPDAFLKTSRHEIGHLLGLGENYGTRLDGMEFQMVACLLYVSLGVAGYGWRDYP
ncbi:MAG: hypothetical protein AAB403_04695 [Planctomycetota bacterium]